MFLNNLEQLRNITWATTYSWDIKFESDDLPEKFREFFPAVSVVDNFGDVGSFSFSGYSLQLKVPLENQSLFIQISFADDNTHSLERWLYNWKNKIFPFDGIHVAPLKSIYKIIYLEKYNSRGETMYFDQIAVYPEGEFSYSGESEKGNSKILSVNFVQVGRKRLKG